MTTSTRLVPVAWIEPVDLFLELLRPVRVPGNTKEEFDAKGVTHDNAAMDMMNMLRLSRRPQAGCGFASAFVLGLAIVASGVSSPGGVDVTAWAQTLNPCTLLTTDEIQPLAGKVSVDDGVSSSLQPLSYVNCRYTWGVGTGRFKIDVVVYDASERFPGMSPDQIKKRLLESFKPGTAEGVISDIGEAAVFKFDSPYYATATAFLKGRILEVHLDGLDARDAKDQAIALLKSAASRL